MSNVIPLPGLGQLVAEQARKRRLTESAQVLQLPIPRQFEYPPMPEKRMTDEEHEAWLHR